MGGTSTSQPQDDCRRGTADLSTPELQLLFKSKHVRPKDTTDAAQVIPELDATAGAFMRRELVEDHPWQRLFASG